MTFENIIQRVSPKLKSIARNLNGHHAFGDDEDLFQEALIYLWNNSRTGKWNDKTDSYILQGCYFFLKNYLRKTEDKFKQVSLHDLTDEEAGLFSDARPANGMESSGVDEILHDDYLTEREKKVLAFLSEGLTLRAIGEKIGVSHVMIIKIKGNLRRKLSGYPGYQNRSFFTCIHKT